ncbi:hypothetical protein JCM14076_28970 [Methylosoma difficile]
MGHKLFTTLAIALLMSALMPIVGHAASIPGLFNTGEGITKDGTRDLNYRFRKTSGSGAGSTGLGRAIVGNGGVVGSRWLADTTTSHWLTLSSNRADNYDTTSDGVYSWTLKFDLTGYDANSAGFNARFAADNNARAFLNGKLIGTANNFSSWHNFSANDFFVNGINTLRFVVTNITQANNNKTGLRVEFLSSNVNVPLPAALWLFSPAIMGLAAMRRKRVS